MSNLRIIPKFMNSKLFGLASVAILMLSTLLAGPACSTPVNTASVFLDYSPGPASSSTPVSQAAFDEKNSHILRCTSLTETENGISATVTKSKSAGIKSLIFVNSVDAQDSSTPTVIIACVNLKGDEGNYDISGAVYRTVKISSAIEAINNFGLTYEDWLTGTLSQDELFPCCK